MKWRAGVNSALRKATGYELRRVPVARPATTPTPTAPPRRKRPRALPPAQLPAGAATASMLFDRYPGVAAQRQKMNLRHEAIVRQNREVFQGARVLDLACSAGAWTFAALDAGAAHVIGIESREDKVELARKNFQDYGVEVDRYEFIVGDVFAVLEREQFQVDLVLCLGFLYHTLRYPELMHHIRATGARTLILDTEMIATDEPYVRLIAENVEMPGNASPDRYSVETTVLSGRPSLAAIEKMLAVYGFVVEQRSDWAAILRDNPELRFPEYQRGQRVTLRCRRGSEMDWEAGGSRR
jgi:SAM-dependent methyltransferase